MSPVIPSERESGKLVVWYMVDGKPGHENQTQGLIEALQQRRSVAAYQAPLSSAWKAVLQALFHSYPSQHREHPHLIIGAGHRTHLTVLAASRSTGARSVILMKPSLPTGLYDYCIVPEHDGLEASDSIINTKGVLNRIRNLSKHQPHRGLILIGGPSAHYHWDNEALLEKIKRIVEHDKNEWVLATSRRTPDSFVERLKTLTSQRLKVVIASDTSPDWLPSQLNQAGRIWITEDSVSMVYEALSSGAPCGLLPVPRKHANRVSDGIDQLLKDNFLSSYEQWEKSGELSVNKASLDEAGRVASLLLESLDE